MHHGVDELLFATLRVTLLQRLHFHIRIAELAHRGAHRGDSLRLVLLDADHAAAAEHLLHDGGADDDFFRTLDHDAVVAGQERFALGAVENQAFRHLAGRRAELDVGRESRTAQTYDTGGLDLVQDGGLVVGDGGHELLAAVDRGIPFIAFDGDLHVHDGIAGEVLARGDGLDRARYGRMDEGGDESARFRDHLADKDFVAHGDDRLGRGAEVLGHRDIDGLRERELLDGAFAGIFAVVGVDTTHRECQFTHWRPPF